MKFRQLGNSGLTVSVVGLGANNFGGRIDAAKSSEVISAALDAGINLIDTSDSYGHGASEEIIGEAVKARRDEVLIATKFGSDMKGANGPDWGARCSRRYVMKAVEASLRRLQTDWIDLYQLHWPDGVTPLEETLEALDDLISQGKVRYAGSSNLSPSQVVESDWISKTRGIARFVSAQNHYSLLERGVEAELTGVCEEKNISLIPYFPLASGLLTGKWKRGSEPPADSRLSGRPVPPDATFEMIEKLDAIAREVGTGLAQLSIAALVARPFVGSVIAGATSTAQVETNASAAEVDLSEEVIEAIDGVTATAAA